MALSNTEQYLIELLISAMDGTAPPAPYAELSDVMKLAEFHSVANLAYYAAEKLELQEELRRKWSQLRDREIMHDIRQTTELALLCSAFQEAGIRFLPLKGAIMKELYPQSDYRSMSDIDILIDTQNISAVRAVMLSIGYEACDLDHGIHDVYTKMPSVSVEIHRELFGDDGKEFAPIFSDIWDHCTSENGFCRLNNEYFFAFLLAHGMKHYQLGGTGVRTFLDLYVFRKAHPDTDTEKICRMFSECGCEKLCRDFMALSDMWFCDKADEKLMEMAEYILRGGTYGTFENQVEYELQSKSKTQYILSKIFPSLSHMKQQYPVLKKIPVLMPLVWLYRLFTKPFINRKQHALKLKTLIKK